MRVSFTDSQKRPQTSPLKCRLWSNFCYSGQEKYFSAHFSFHSEKRFWMTLFPSL